MGSEALVQYVEHLPTQVDEDQGEASHGHPAGTDAGTEPCQDLDEWDAERWTQSAAVPVLQAVRSDPAPQISWQEDQQPIG